MRQVKCELLSLYPSIFRLKFVKKVCSTHSLEAIHVVIFHLYCVCYENFGPEHGRKARSEIGGGEILSLISES